MTTRNCRVCQIEYSLERFSGGRTKCKNCYAKDKREKQREDPEKYKQATKKWYETKGKEWKKNYETEHKEEINTRERERYKNDPIYRNKKIIRNRLASTINGTKIYSKISEKIAMEHKMFLEWLEFQFTDDMTWENQGSYWGIDHIIPIDYFVKNEPNEQDSVHHWSNLRPCVHKGKDGNFSKNNKIDLDLIKDHFCVTVPSFIDMKDLDLDNVVQRLQRKWAGEN